MYKKILVPVDLAHIERLENAIDIAADLAKHYGASLCFVGVTTSTPSEVAHTPQEYSRKLEQFAGEQGARHGTRIESFACTSHDPAVDLNDRLLQAIEESGCDLVVMASHLPGLPEHILASHAGAVASHARVSVFVIR